MSAEFDRLVSIVARLRAPDGCPWDREQTIDTLKPYILEETYEVLEAIDEHDHGALREELGDFLFEAVFVAQLEHEAGRFSIDDAVKSVADKLVRRHPHVFERDRGERSLDNADQVRTRWEEIKAQERAAKEATAKAPGETGDKPKVKTLLSGVPEGLPALLRAYQIGIRAASVGFEWERPADVVAKIQEEVDEVREVLAEVTVDQTRAEEELGDLLFAIANLSRKLGVEPETALRKANAKFARRFTAMESHVLAGGQKLADVPLAELELVWEQVKRALAKEPDPAV